MATIDINQYMGPLLFEAAPPDSGAGNAHDRADKSFDDYLHRARTCSSGNGDNGKSGPERESPQFPAPPAENSAAAASCAPSRNNSATDREDTAQGGLNNAEDADSAEISNQSKPNQRQPEDGQRPIDKAQGDSKTKDKKTDEKKETHNEQDPDAMQQAQAIQTNSQINHPAADKNNESPIENKAVAVTAETKKTVDPLPAALKDAQNIPTDIASQTAAEELPGVPVVKSIKGNTPKKVVHENGQKAEKPLPDMQTEESNLLSNDKNSTASKTSKFNDKSSAVKKASNKPAAAAHDGQQKPSHKTSNKEGLSAQVTDSPVSASVTNESPVTPVINTAALQVGINPALIKPVETAADNPKTEPASSKNSDATINPAQRMASAEKIATGLSQTVGDGAQSQIDRVRFVQRVERAFAAVGDRGGSLRLKLSPPELGSLRLEVTVRKGAIRARVEAETPEAKNLLLDNLPALRDKLAQHDIKIQQFDVDLMDRSPGGTPQQTTHQAPSGSRQDDYRHTRSKVRENSDAAPSSTGTASLKDHSGQLNVIV
jgi:flagellar hook-length control protein FliK